MRPPARPTALKRLGILSDLHCGSRYGLVPPAFRPSRALPSAPFHDHLWRCWQAFCRDCPPLDTLVVNGELTEGETPTQREALDAITDDPHVQADMAIETLGLLMPKVRELVILRGTAFHEGKHYETIERLAQELGARPWAPRRYTGFVLNANFHGIHLNVTHHMTTGAIYRGTLADRTALFAAAAEMLGKTEHADVIIRSHNHMKYLGKTHGRWVVMTPAWKLTTPYAYKRMEYYRASLLSDIGAIVLTTEGYGDITWREFDYAPCLWPEQELGV